MNNNNASPIFVVGAPRSGTTLTAKILGLHPAVFMPGETHFFDDIYSRRAELGEPVSCDGAKRIAAELISLYGRYNEPIDQQRLESIFTEEKLAKKIHEQCQDYEQVFTLFMSVQMHRQSKTLWGNNAPRDIFNIGNIREFYPNAKIIICSRDPRDFLGSYKGKWRATSEREEDRLRQLYHPVITSLLWSSSMKQLKAIRESFPEDNILVSPYEKLVTSPAKVVEGFCRFIGVSFEAEMLGVQFSNSSENSGADAQIFSSSVGKWRDRLSPEEIWICQKICAAEMAQLGYSIDTVRANSFKLLLQIIKTPFALFRALRANRHKRGPLLPYLAKRIAIVIRGSMQ